MEITSLAGAASPAATGSSASQRAMLDYNSFLKLLIAHLTFSNPASESVARFVLHLNRYLIRHNLARGRKLRNGM